MKDFNFTLQIKGEENKVIGNIVQNDTANRFIIRLRDGISPVLLDETDIITVTYKRNNDTVVVDAMGGETIAVTDYEKGEIIIVPDEAAVRNVGMVNATVEIYDAAGKKLSSARFSFTVTPDLAGHADASADSSFPALQNLITLLAAKNDGWENAEAQRVANENVRVTNEDGRVTAEQERAQVWAQLEEMCRGLIKEMVSPDVEVKTSTPTEYVLTITDKNGVIETPNLKAGQGSGNGDMMMADYDSDKDGSVDRADVSADSEKLDGHEADYFMPKSGGTAELPTLKWTLSDGGTVTLRRSGSDTKYQLSLVLDKADGTQEIVGLVNSNSNSQISNIMMKSAYDSNLDGIVNRADNGIFEYTHSKNGTVHNLQGSGEYIAFYPTADWNPGDTLTINGQVVNCRNEKSERVENEELFKYAGFTVCYHRYGECFFKQGGAGMNFKIVGGTTQPASPKENTIWINTSTSIKNWQFASSQPTKRADGTALQTGDLWINTGTKSITLINAVKKNAVFIYVQSCMQWDGSQWQMKDVKIYQNGKWDDAGYVFIKDSIILENPLIVNAVGTGTQNKNVFSFPSGDKRILVGWQIDLTNITTFEIELSFSLSSYNNLFIGVFSETHYNPEIARIQYNTNSGGTLTKSTTEKIDTTSLNGTYYIGIIAHSGGGGGSSNATILNAKVY